MYCRYPNRRAEIVEKYEIKPVFRSIILPGQEKWSCTNDLLEKEYFLFRYKEKHGETEGTFYCGRHAADHFCTLTGEALPPSFNPLKADSASAATGSSGSKGSGQGKRKGQLHPASKQLYDAINLIVVCWNSPPGPPLARVLEKIEQYGYNAPFPSEVKTVNTVIKRGGRALPSMLMDLRHKGHDLRDFKFDMIHDILKDRYPDEPSFLE